MKGLLEYERAFTLADNKRERNRQKNIGSYSRDRFLLLEVSFQQNCVLGKIRFHNKALAHEHNDIKNTNTDSHVKTSKNQHTITVTHFSTKTLTH